MQLQGGPGERGSKPEISLFYFHRGDAIRFDNAEIMHVMPCPRRAFLPVKYKPAFEARGFRRQAWAQAAR